MYKCEYIRVDTYKYAYIRFSQAASCIVCTTIVVCLEMGINTTANP